MNKKRVGLNVLPVIPGACALLMLFSLAVPAQEPRLFQLENFNGALLMLFDRTLELENYLGEVQRDISRKYLEGGVQLDTAGSIYHPNFLSFTVNVNILAHRTRNLVFSDASINNDVNNTYDIRLTFLKKKKLNFQVYAIRNYFSFDRAFYERYFTIFKNIGALVTSKTKLFPFTLDVYVNRMKSESLSFPERDERSKNLDFKMDLLGVTRTNSRLTLKLKDYSESVYDINFQSMDLMANFQHFFGGKRSTGSDSIFSIFTFNRITGDSDFSSLNLYNSIFYHLRKNLDARGEYRLVKDESFNRSSTRHDVSTRLHHRLYESLNTELMVGGRVENSNFLDAGAWRYGISFNYQKKIPTGFLRLLYSNQREHGEYRYKGELVNTSERLTFSFADTIVITSGGINVGSIIVTDPNLMHIYVPDVDYHVSVVQNVVTITRLPGGAIPRAGTVLVHFEYASAPDFKIKLKRYRLETYLKILKFFRFFYRYAVNEPVIESDYTYFPFEDYKKRIVGAQFHTRFLRAEYYREKYDSSLSDYISRNYRLTVNIRIGRFLRLSGDVMLNRLNYVPRIYFSHLDAYTAECSLFPFSRLNIKGMYRRLNYSIPEVFSERESVILKLHWSIRQIIVEFFYEHIFTGSTNLQRDRDYFSIMIRRRF